MKSESRYNSNIFQALINVASFRDQDTSAIQLETSTAFIDRSQQCSRVLLSAPNTQTSWSESLSDIQLQKELNSSYSQLSTFSHAQQTGTISSQNKTSVLLSSDSRMFKSVTDNSSQYSKQSCRTLSGNGSETTIAEILSESSCKPMELVDRSVQYSEQSILCKESQPSVYQYSEQVQGTSLSITEDTLTVADEPDDDAVTIKSEVRFVMSYFLLSNFL